MDVISFCIFPGKKAAVFTDILSTYSGGSRGRVQGVRTPPWDDLRFSNTTSILEQKKKLCGLLELK